MFILFSRYRPIITISVSFAFFALLCLIFFSYQPGLGGTLVFDDLPNLQPWADLKDIHNLQQTLTFTFSGVGLPGRPLSLLSFLIDDQSWPPDIFTLKRTNLAIHLINTCLIFWLALKILAHLLPQRYAQLPWLALLITAIWALHPLQVSNVSYIIQRMNLLVTLLELAGLVLFIYGREQLTLAPRKALLLCSLSIGLFMPLAVLAKENGLLLCAFVLLIESFCFPANTHRFWRYWKLLFLWLPLVIFLAYLLVTFQGFTAEYPSRNFNSWERLLTQGPVMLDYLNKLVLPRLQGSGLYFDNFPVSRSLFQPLNTFFSWIFLLGLLGVCFWQRKKNALFAFGIFFYFIGHLMESTLIPLELYFEHRNYLPQFGLWIALVGLLIHIPRSLNKFMIGLSLLLIVVLALMTRNNATLWGHPDTQAAIWYHDNPASLRAATDYSNLLLFQGRYQELDTVLSRMLKDHPDSLFVPLSQRYIQCYWRGIPTSFDDLAPLARTAPYETASVITLERMRTLATGTTDPNAPTEKGCSFATLNQITTIYLALLENPHYRDTTSRGRIFEYLAEIAVKNHQLNIAIQYYEQAFIASNNPIYAYRQALLLQSIGQPTKAFTALQQAENALTLKQKTMYPSLAHRITLLKQSWHKEKAAP